ncbi:MAG: hypothetical protein MJZ67_07310 [Bacteroidales bacterium]|nr:hypothetical protein [Bacteroidales bacterium]
MDKEKKKEIILSVLNEEGKGYLMPSKYDLESIVEAIDKCDKKTVIWRIAHINRTPKAIYGIPNGTQCYGLILKKISEEENRENELTKVTDELAVQKEQKKREYASQLELVEKYKDTLMFLESVQEKIRKEREQFYNEKIKLVTVNLKETGLDSVITTKWIEDLVSNYSKSLDISNEIFADATEALKNEFIEKSREIELTKKI